MRRGYLAFVLVAVLAGPAFAQAALVESSPAKDSSVAGPRSIGLTFSDRIVPGSSGFTLAMADGMTMSPVVKVSGDGKTMTGMFTSPFMQGRYTLSWHAVSADGKPSQGSYDFTVK